MERYRLFAPLLIGCIMGFCACGRGSDHVTQPRGIIDLSPLLSWDLNTQRLGSRATRFLGTEGRTTYEPVVPGQADLAFGLDRICLLSHVGSYLDAPARLLRGGERPGQIALNRLIGPARLADLRWHNRDSPLQITDLEQVPIEAGDILILFVGYKPPAAAEEWPRYAQLSTQTSEWLAAKRIRALATDMPAIIGYDVMAARLRAHQAPEKAWSEYVPLFQAQIPVIAGLVNLEAIPKDSNFLFVALPLATVDGGGAPVRAAALLY